MRALPTILISVALIGAACSSESGSSSPTTTDRIPSDTSGSGGSGRFVGALQPFDSCNAYLDHVKAEAKARVGPYGLDGGGNFWLVDEIAVGAIESDFAEEGGAAPRTDTGTPVSGDDGGSYSTTNVQEVGVDEPDIVKTDGDRILTIRNNTLSLIEVNGSSSQVTDQIKISDGWNHELFFKGDRAFVFTNGGDVYGGPFPVEPFIDEQTDSDDAELTEPEIGLAPIDPNYYGPSATIIEVDLSDPNDLRITGSMRIEGQYLSARAIGDTVRIALSSGPQQLPWVYPQGPSGEDRATETNQDIIDDSTIDDWIPNFEIIADGASTSGPLVDCDRLNHPAEFAGFDVISVVQLDLAAGLAGGFDTGDTTGVLAGGETIYSSTDRFYVATTKWVEPNLPIDGGVPEQWNEDYQTDLHTFAIADDAKTEYVASGSVDGSLLNQFSLDEHDGYLRVITTEGSPWGGSEDSESRLVVLQEQGDRLISVGEVGGLGKGEQLFSARLLDEIGFAVTFRQTDPFYVLDLSDPTNPQVTGELKIPGFSTYLHPVGDDHVLGVGQAADEDGRTLGLKLSLFDVSDPAAPREVSVWTMRDANSVAEYDHRAFQMWGTTAIVPVRSWSNGFDGVILFDVDGSISEIGRVSHTNAQPNPSSGCEVVPTDGLSEDSELFWIASDGQALVQHCDGDAIGGYGSYWCDSIPADEIVHWFSEQGAGEEFLESIGADDGSRIEICYPDDYGRGAIDRSLIIDETLWTLSPAAIQANHLADLSFATHLPL